jgi:hypothetical protein
VGAAVLALARPQLLAALRVAGRHLGVLHQARQQLHAVHGGVLRQRARQLHDVLDLVGGDSRVAGGGAGTGQGAKGGQGGQGLLRMRSNNCRHARGSGKQDLWACWL